MVRNPPASAGDIRDTGSIPASRRYPGEDPTPVFFPGEFHGKRSLVGYIQSAGLQREGHD